MTKLQDSDYFNKNSLIKKQSICDLSVMAGSAFLNFKMKPGETFSSKFLEFLFEILGGNPIIEILS